MRALDPGEDVTVVVRECGERTAELCVSLLRNLLPAATFERVSSSSFNQALRASLQAGLDAGRAWTLCIDADVLVDARLLDWLEEARHLPADTFAAQALVTDKLLLCDRPAGNHLYRTGELEAAVPLIPASDSLRPETEMIQAMGIKGFALYQSRIIIGFHDFEQANTDLYAKAFLHGHKHRHLVDLYRQQWEALARSDSDFEIALGGLRDALAESAPSVIRRRVPSVPLAEKPALAVHASDLSRLQNAPRSAPLQRALDEAVFPARRGSASESLRQLAARTLRWRRLVRPFGPVTPRAQRRKRRRLLFAIDSLVGGGAERVLTRLANHFAAAGDDVQIAMTLGLDNVQNVDPRVSIVRIPNHVPSDRYIGSNFHAKRIFIELFEDAATHLTSRRSEGRSESLLELQRELHNYRILTAAFGRHMLAWRPDLVVSFLPNSNLIALLARSFYGIDVPMICSDRNALEPELARLPFPEHRRFLARRQYRAADRHVVLSPVAGDYLVRTMAIAPERIVTIPNGVAIDNIRRLAGEGPSSARPPGRLELVAVGRLTQQKGFDLLLDALGSLDPALEWQLSLLGEGEEEERLRGLAEVRGIAGRVAFLGWQANPYPVIAQSDAFVLSSRWEGMPNALLEALALGVAVVATDCETGPREILADGRYGQLVPVGDPGVLSGAIARLFVEEERRRYAALARERAEAYSFEAVTKRWESLFRDVLPAQ